MKIITTWILAVLGLISAGTIVVIGAPMYYTGTSMPQWADYLRYGLLVYHGFMTLLCFVAVIYGTLLEPGFWRTDTQPSDG